MTWKPRFPQNCQSLQYSWRGGAVLGGNFSAKWLVLTPNGESRSLGPTMEDNLRTSFTIGPRAPVRWVALRLLWLPLWALTCTSLLAAEPSAAPQAGLLVLANGSVLEGIITAEGDYYRVMLPKGELRVRSTQVDFFCQTLDEAYAGRRERVQTNTADAHLDLARWCLQHAMLEHATAEIAHARSLEPRHRMVGVLTRQVEQSREANTKAETPQESPSPTQPAGDSTVIEPVAAPAAAEIPQWARVEFVRRIQPLLIHSCATGAVMPPTNPASFGSTAEHWSGLAA